MQLITNLERFPDVLRRGAVSIGNFDGVHRGHAQLVAKLKETAHRIGGPAVVFTFDPHPVRVLRPEATPPPLTWTDRKAELLAELGVQATVAYPTDESLLALSAEDFFRNVIRSRLDARALVEGPNFLFGRGRTGDIATLRTLCGQAGIHLEIAEPEMQDGEYVSSSRVRRLLLAGEVAQANELLTRPYRLRGLVTHGDSRGAKIGYPTANLDGLDTLLPAAGVYAGRAIVAKDAWPAAIHCGPVPTFGLTKLRVEVHLVDFSGSLYGRVIEVDFLARLRDIRAFGSVQELQEQMAKDVAVTRELAGRTEPPGASDDRSPAGTP